MTARPTTTAVTDSTHAGIIRTAAGPDCIAGDAVSRRALARRWRRWSRSASRSRSSCSPRRATTCPGLPPYDYSPLNGDATGFYAESRELISVAFGPAGAAALLLLAAGAVAVWRLRRSWMAIAGRLPRRLARGERARARPADDRGGRRRLAAALVDPALPVPRRRPARRGRRVRRRASALARSECGHGRRHRVHRSARHRQPRRRHRGGGALRGLAAADAPARRDERLGERPVERRRRAAPLHGADLDSARRDRDRAAARTVARPCPARGRWRAARLRDRRPAVERALRRGGGCARRAGGSGRRPDASRLRPPGSRSRRSSRSTGRRGIRRSRTCPASRSTRQIAAGSTRSLFDPRTLLVLLPLAVLGLARRRRSGTPLCSAR